MELTGPYFHNGGAATLERVLEFYGRNGDVPAGGNLGPGVGNIRLGQQDRAEIVEFLKALTDDRVRYERAPFDHPSICVPVGYAENPAGVLTPDTSPDGHGRRQPIRSHSSRPPVGTAIPCRCRRSPNCSPASGATERALTRCNRRAGPDRRRGIKKKMNTG